MNRWALGQLNSAAFVKTYCQEAKNHLNGENNHLCPEPAPAHPHSHDPTWFCPSSKAISEPPSGAH